MPIGVPMGSKPLAAEQCVAAGGHCWVREPFVVTEAVMGGRSTAVEGCKHCPATRRGVSREPWEWTYPEGQP